MRERTTKRIHVRRGWELNEEGRWSATASSVTSDELEGGTSLDDVWNGEGPYYDSVIEIDMTMPPRPVEADTAPAVTVRINTPADTDPNDVTASAVPPAS